jgi:hypothetical protein
MVNIGYFDLGLSRSKVDLYIPHTCDSSAAGFMKILDVYKKKVCF